MRACGAPNCVALYVMIDSPMNARNPSLVRCSSEQDKLRHRIRATPDDRVLFQSGAEDFGRFQLEPENQKAWLAGKLIGRVLSDAFKEAKTSLCQFCCQRCLACGVRLFIEHLAEWVACGYEGAAVASTGTVQRSELGAVHTDF